VAGDGMKTTVLRAILGFVVAPFVPALLVYASSIAMHGGSRGEATWGLGLFASLGYGAALVLGVPAYFVFRARGITGFVPYLAMGALIGVACVIFGFLPHLVFSGPETYPGESATLLGLAGALSIPAIFAGAIASTVFWLIAVRRLSF